MESRALLIRHLERSREHALRRIDDMRAHACVAPTPRGGGHTLWTLGHLAYVEALIVHTLLRGEPHPFAAWEARFDGAEVSADPADYPPLDDVLAAFVQGRDRTLAWLAGLTEADLDRPSARVPAGFEGEFATWRAGLQFVGDHTYMHRGQLADARRAAGVDRMWV